MRLNQQRVVVLGGSSGLGLATAQAAMREGAEVVIVGRSPERLAQAQEFLPRAKMMAADATDEAAVQQLFAEIGTIQHVFVTAAEATLGTIQEKSFEAVRPTLDSKLSAAYHAAKYGAPQIVSGSITFVSGLAAWRPFVGGTTAAAANAGLEAMGRILALELKPIRVNTVVPGVIDTPLLNQIFGTQKEEQVRKIAESLPVGRIGTPEDVAEAVVFLMASSFITGSVLHVDGGALLT